MNSCRFTRDEPLGRRGMLLLMVLSMLTLFLLMGTLALVLATRARESARAFSDAVAGKTNMPVIAQAMADEALMILIRGSQTASVNDAIGNDSLLKDMYGTQGNGKKFVDEPYDAFDDNNRFLTKVTLDSDGRVTDVPRPAFRPTSATTPPAEVDNDGDGVADSIWLEGILPALSMAGGGDLQFRVAYLVLDLDGRINVNTHGRRSDAPAPQAGQIGPADVNASSMFTTDIWTLLMAKTDGQLLPGTPSPSTQWRLPPPVSSPVDGRFGGSADVSTYAIRLDLEAPRPALLRGATTQNPFTLGELERVLRQFDADSSTLPPRLAAILHDRAERNRMRITTDSWETPAQRANINWVAANSGVKDEKIDWQTLCDIIMNSGAVPAAQRPALEQWVANLMEFRDIDVANTNFGGGLRGSEPGDITPAIPGGDGGWNKGYFSSYAELLAVPKGTAQEWQQRRQATPPEPLVSLAKEYPKILEAVMTPSLFQSTIAVDPAREPGRVNVNTCDIAVWKAMLGQDKENPFDGDPANAAKDAGELLMNVPLVFPDATYDVSMINHGVANRLANVATVRSHVFAIWITVEIKDTSPTAGDPTYHRLFAIVDRSIPAVYQQGQNTDARNMIRLKRFLN